jgi:cytochrome c-type biogenesis protein CcmF
VNTEPDIVLRLAPEWSLWLGWIGRGSLWLALGLFVASAIAWLLSPGRPGLDRFGARAFTFGSLGVFGAMVVLATLLLTDQFHFVYVYEHSDRSASLIMQFASLWAGQEGSILLWAVCTATFGLLAGRRTGVDRRWFSVVYSAFMAGIASILVFESPFVVELFQGRPFLPTDGSGINPILRNYWIVIHPPVIFLGFAALTVVFAWAFSALARRDLTGWVQPVRPWVILTATMIGLGLCLGGFWAYETLGWGGFWAWDPVENVSFVPWLFSVALIHGLYVQQSRGKWAYANAALAGLGLTSWVYGTFLVRSGFLGDASVHSFVEMDRTALWLLTGLGLTTATAFFGLWAARLRQAMRTPPEPDLLPREGPRRDQAIGMALWLLVSMALAAGIGMSVPLVMSLGGRDPSVVEEGLYNLVFAWLTPPVLLLVAIGPWLTWRGLPVRKLLDRLAYVISLTLAGTGMVMLALHFVPNRFKPDPGATVDAPFGTVFPLVPWMMFLIALCLFALIGSVWKTIESARRSGMSAGGFLTHAGVVMTLAGLIVSRGFEQTQQVFVQEGNPVSALGYMLRFEGLSKDLLTPGNQVKMSLTGPEGTFRVAPQLFYIPREGQDPQSVVRPDILFRGWHDLYIAIHPMIFDATEPIELQPGQTVEIPGGTLTHHGIVTEGQPGQDGTIFRADLTMSSADGVISTRPGMRLLGGGTQIVPAPAGEGLQSMLLRMDAATRAVTVQLQFERPLFPVEVFYKPMTILTWAGVGIMVLGGLLAAMYRRRALRSQKKPEPQPAPAPEDAPQPFAQV